MDPNIAMADDVESNVPAPAEGTALVDSGPVTMSQGGGAREAYLHMMDVWYLEFIFTNPNTPPPPPPLIPQPIHIAPQGAEIARREKPLMDRIRKHGAKEFRANIDDESKRAEFWLENTIRVLDELSCTHEECLKCVVSLLKDTAYYWWKMLVLVVHQEKVTWEFF